MKPHSPEAIEAQARAFLSDLLMAVPLARAQGDDAAMLAALERAALFTPVFPDWPTPVDDWLQQAQALARARREPETLRRLILRRAVVLMRRREFDEALAALAQAGEVRGAPAESGRGWLLATRARILVRRQQFDAARATLETLAGPRDAGWTGWLPVVARAELQLECGEFTAAAATLHTALLGLPAEVVEERIQMLQSLGFVLIAQVEPQAARARLDEARHLLRAAGAWPEVIQMELAVGSLHAACGDAAAAQCRFDAAAGLCERYPQPQLETLLGLASARALAAQGQAGAAVAAALEVAKGYARQGSVIGYVSMIVFVAALHVDAGRHDEAYRALATGLAVARHRGWAVVEQVLRGRITHLRDAVLGPERFDAMARALVERMKGG
ncbi:hypothetical protein [Thauera sinica]|uniref:Uncharacterized protein n=1 Tax=Thauera sinica TaxID=2665146 RepID=A0ABW1AX03_9RHOO|nr:hypothetical protein [Thauera sp. K11]ATE59888.1 hypothetical protein CCZ27_07930 [Thauera sp. K11]